MPTKTPTQVASDAAVHVQTLTQQLADARAEQKAAKTRLAETDTGLRELGFEPKRAERQHEERQRALDEQIAEIEEQLD